MVKPHFHASHLRVFISYTRASLSHYSPKSLLHRPLYLISVVHDAPPSRQFWYRIMVSRLNDASKASSSLLFSWGGSGEVTPAKSLMRAKSSSTAYDTANQNTCQAIHTVSSRSENTNFQHTLHFLLYQQTKRGDC